MDLVQVTTETDEKIAEAFRQYEAEATRLRARLGQAFVESGMTYDEAVRVTGKSRATLQSYKRLYIAQRDSREAA